MTARGSTHENTLNRALSVAPMMGYTDRHCRFLFRQLSPNTLLYSEMLTTGALIHGETNKFLAHREDEPCALQLGGSHPADLARCARMIEEAGYQEVNLNCGCPSDRVQQGGIGACLMAEPDLVADCYRAMASEVTIPVTIKCRIGIDDRDDYKHFKHFISTLHDAGCRIFQIHARKAILTGLSPKENREIPPLKYDYVRRIQEDFPDSCFILNGGIKTVDEVQQLMKIHPGVMLGRAAYSNPYLLAELDALLFGTAPITRDEAVRRYLRYIEQEMMNGVYIKHMAKHLLGLYTGMPGARAFRRHLSNTMFAEKADTSIILEALSFVSPDYSETGT